MIAPARWICHRLLAGLIILAGAICSLSAQSYVPPAGSAAPVAPPLKKGSPLDHLANDPRMASLPVGYREGNTTGTDFWIAHRLIDPVGGQGWGWVKRDGEAWGDAQWIALQETPGRCVAPHRKLVSSSGDMDWEFKFWGTFAPYKAYDPRLDEQLPVFVLAGYEVIGPASPLPLKAGPSNRIFQKKSGASSRASSPIQNDPGID